MRKKLLISLTFITYSIYAQERSGAYIFFGGNKPNLKTNAVEAKSGGIGYQGGIGAIMGYSKHFSYQSELTFKYSPIELKNISGSQDLYNFTSFQAATFVTYNVIEAQKDKVYFGPMFGLFANVGRITKKDGNYTPITYTPSMITQNTIYENSAKINYGLSFGANITYNKFKLRATYDIGLSDYFKGLKGITNYDSNGDPIYSYANKAKLSSITFSLQYKLSRF